MRRKYHNKQLLDRYRNEIVQCYVRMGLIVIALISLPLLETLGSQIENRQVYRFFFGYAIWIFSYFLLIKKFPYQFIRSRVLIAMVADILATAWAMYLAGELSSIFVAVFLWYIIGYGMRFGLSVAVVATAIVTFSWLLLGFTSTYWSARPYHVTGWLIAFLIIPVYYFLLVKRLHISAKELRIALLEMEKLANFDSLTQLANRNYFNSQAEKMLAQHGELAILLIDLDGFKNVNDYCGHEAGDRALVAIARCLKYCCDNSCIVGRLGGDEFIIAATGKTEQEVCLLAETVTKEIAPAGNEYGNITASIGISFCPHNAGDLSHAKGCADSAMYTAKSQGKNCYSLY